MPLSWNRIARTERMLHDLKEKAQAFRALNDRSQLLLPNAWDAASARIFEEAGFPAVGTTSDGISYALGTRDGELLDRDTAVAQCRIIACAVSVPVSADMEAGYGADAAAVAQTAGAALDAGVVGINLEDNTHGDGLFTTDAQANRIAEARNEADRRDIPLTINARTDVFLLGLGDNESERLTLTISRGRAYLQAGADLVFVPLVVDLAIIHQLAEAFDGKLSVMAIPGIPSAAEMFRAGARRVSIGQAAMLASLGLVSAIAKELKSSGTWAAIEETFFGFAEAESLFTEGSA